MSLTFLASTWALAFLASTWAYDEQEIARLSSLATAARLLHENGIDWHPRWKALFPNPCGLYFIQLGANTGKRLNVHGVRATPDPIWDHMARYGWRGAAIEPNPQTFKVLRRNYERYSALVKTLNVAVASASGNLTFYCPDLRPKDLRMHITPLQASEGCTTHARYGPSISKSRGNQFVLPALTLADLWAELRPAAVDVLVMDLEGTEAELLPTPLPTPKPTAVLFEISGFSEQRAFPRQEGARRLRACHRSLREQGYVPLVSAALTDYNASRSSLGEVFMHKHKDELWMRASHLPRAGAVHAPVESCTPAASAKQ